MGGFTFTESAPGTNLFGLDPLLGPLAYNGGPTLTRALLPGSPALDRGSNPEGLTEDQRGYGSDRVVGAAADIGAYESRDSDVRLVPDPLDRQQERPGRHRHAASRTPSACASTTAISR